MGGFENRALNLLIVANMLVSRITRNADVEPN
jgi:hypothetical protein